jgi:hypothetical protein
MDNVQKIWHLNLYMFSGVEGWRQYSCAVSIHAHVPKYKWDGVLTYWMYPHKFVSGRFRSRLVKTSGLYGVFTTIILSHN